MPSRIRLVGRNDAFLLAGLTAALFVIFSRPIARLLDFARSIEESRGLRLLPALVILAGVFIAHQLVKRQQMRSEALAAAAEARQARARAEELERLVAFGQALARSLDAEAIRAAVAEHLPVIAPGRSAWALVRSGAHWQPLLTLGDATTAGDREAAADRAVGEMPSVVGGIDADACFPMIVGGAPVGVLAVSAAPALAEDQRRVLAAAAALLGVSIKNAELFREIHENSVRDGLTGCFNRKHALEVIDAELRRARRSQLPLALIMLDLDRFKTINDRFGHLCGDAVLAAVGARMKEVLRGSDLKCRYGGEEFLILLPDTPLPGAQRVAETLRRALEQQPVRWNDDQVSVTASLGLTPIVPGEFDIEAIIGRADAALYRAKQEGRNCVRMATEYPSLI